MNKTVFPVTSMSRKDVKWEDHLYDLTPVEKHGALWFKRDDYFAPLGYGSVNGSKMRQCLWLIHGFITERSAIGIVSGSVVGSPQHPMVASICKHYNIGCLIATPAPDVEKHEYLKMAKDWDSKFFKTNIGYARALQSISFKLQKKLWRHEVVETNITVDERLNPASRVEAFHAIGAKQVENIPDDCVNIIIPAGSCNSAVSVMYGLWKYRPKKMKRIVLMGIGNNGSANPKYVQKRLKIIGSVIGSDVAGFFNYPWESTRNLSSIDVVHFDINGSGFCQYSTLMPFQNDGIEFHPRYEGKVMNYMEKYPEKFTELLAQKTVFWVVGSAPNP